MSDPAKVVEILAPIVAARRERAEDDLISVLVEAEYTDEDGVVAPPVRRRDLLVRHAPARGRLGHDVEADGHHAGRASSSVPRCSTRCATTARCVRPAIEESLRWMPTDPMFSRHVTARRRVLRRAPPAGLGAAPLPRRRQPRSRALGAARRVRHHPAAEAVARVRQRPARVPRHARRPRRDDRRHQRAARPPARTCGSIPTPSRPATSACTNAAPLRSRWCSDDRQRARLPGARPHPARRGAHPPVPRDRRRGGLPLERRADAPAHHHRAPQRRAAHLGADLRAATATTTSSSRRWAAHRSTRRGTSTSPRTPPPRSR